MNAFSGLTLFTLAKLGLAFVLVDILRKLVVPKIVERIMARGYKANETARLALVDILGFLQQVEQMVGLLLKDEKALRPTHSTALPDRSKVAHFTDLVAIGSEYRVLPPALSRKELLDAFASGEIQRYAINLFDFYHRFSVRSQDNRDAFYWLLDNHDAWESLQVGPAAQVRERLILLNDARRMMRIYLFDMLAYGYRLAELLCEEASSGWTVNQTFERFERDLRALFALDPDGIRWRRAFYAVRDRREIFHEDAPMSLVRWNDEVARATPDAIAEVWWASDRKRRAYRLPAMTVVALPVGRILARKIRIRYQRRTAEKRTIPRPIALGPTSGGPTNVRDIQLFV